MNHGLTVLFCVMLASCGEVFALAVTPDSPDGATPPPATPAELKRNVLLVEPTNSGEASREAQIAEMRAAPRAIDMSERPSALEARVPRHDPAALWLGVALIAGAGTLAATLLLLSVKFERERRRDRALIVARKKPEV